MCVKHLYQGCKVDDKGCKLFIVRGVNVYGAKESSSLIILYFSLTTLKYA